jgi:choline-sulfatase
MFGRTFGTLKDFHNPESKLSYSALVTGMDHNLGRIVNRLEELGIRENTVIAFSADQGHCCGHHGIWGKGNSTVPFNMYEESLHVPLIWNHPGQIAAGRVLDPLISSYDFFPTILDYLDRKPEQDHRRPGHSYAGFLRGKPPRWRDELYFEYEYVRGIRTKNLKYIERTSEWPSELFDLEADPGEKKNVIDARDRRTEVKALQSRLHTFFQHVGAPPIDQWRSTTKQQLPVYGR